MGDVLSTSSLFLFPGRLANYFGRMLAFSPYSSTFLVPVLARLVPVLAPPECILVQNTAAERLSMQFSVLTITFIRDCMLACGAGTLKAACKRKA